jgi:hypothetical protein
MKESMETQASFATSTVDTVHPADGENGEAQRKQHVK